MGVGSLNVKNLSAFPTTIPEQEAEIHLRDTQNNPFDRLAIFPVSVQSCSRFVRLVLGSSALELQLT